MKRPVPLLLALLAVLGAALTAGVIPKGVFTLDENHHLVAVLALQEGRLTVPGTEDASPSRELLYFDPAARFRDVESTPVAPTIPPLYPFLALPFSYLGWRGLVLLNTLAFLAAVGMVFAYTRRYAGGESAAAAPWLAAGALALGSYCLEYAMGLWPHMLALALATGALLLAARARDGAPLAVAFAAGVAAALAAGVRYQNIVFAGGVGLGILLLASRRRLASSFAYGCGAALPLAAMSFVNHLRLGFWNPISKGPRYLSVGAGDRLDNPFVETVAVFWSKVVDFTHHLAMPQHPWLRPDPRTGAFLNGPALKKAWLQSCPWVALVLLVLILVWLRRGRDGAAGDLPSRARRELKAAALVVFPILLAFSLAGFRRMDGVCFNQRYFLEMLPLAAAALGWSAAPLLRRRRAAFLGLVAGALLALLFILPLPPTSALRQMALMKVPLFLALVLVSFWVLHRLGRDPGPSALVLGACLGWAAAVHLAEDVPGSRRVRAFNRQMTGVLEHAVPDHGALFAYWGSKDAAGPLHLDRDVVVLDPWIDDGEDAPRLIDEMLAAGRRVIVLADGFPPPLLERLLAGRPVRPARGLPVEILEVGREAPPAQVSPSESSSAAVSEGDAGG